MIGRNAWCSSNRLPPVAGADIDSFLLLVVVDVCDFDGDLIGHL